MVFTIYCCGTCSNSFDAFGDMSRPEDKWDKDPKAFEALWARAQAGDQEAKAQFREIVEARRKTVGLRKTYFQGEIVSTLAKNNKGKEYAEWILVDGPGSGNYQSKTLWARAGNYSDTRGVVTGAGMDESVRHALAFIKGTPDESLYRDDVEMEPDFTKTTKPAPIKMHGLNSSGQKNTSLSGITPQMLQQEILRRGRKSKGITKVNLIGWSRGAVTCIMIANAIAADPDLKGIRVRIFAVDPVPGGLNQAFYSSMTSLPRCVDEYFGVYARDEVSRNFSPVIPKTKMSTSVTLLPMPGMHATVAGNSFLDKNASVHSAFNLEGPGRITRFWAERCLMRWGVNMERTARYSDTELCNMYEQILAADGEFKKMRGYSYVKMKQGYWNTYRQFYMQGSGWLSNYWTLEELGNVCDAMKMMTELGGRTFVNWHHLAVYKKTHRNWRRRHGL